MSYTVIKVLQLMDSLLPPSQFLLSESDCNEISHYYPENMRTGYSYSCYIRPKQSSVMMYVFPHKQLFPEFVELLHYRLGNSFVDQR